MRTAMRRNEPSGMWPEEMANEINSDSSGIRCPFSAAPAEKDACLAQWSRACSGSVVPEIETP